MFNQPEEPRYITFDEIESLLDSLMAEKLEVIYCDIKAECERLIAMGEM